MIDHFVEIFSLFLSLREYMIDPFVETFLLFSFFLQYPLPLCPHDIGMYTQSYFLYLYYSLIFVDHRTHFIKYIY